MSFVSKSAKLGMSAPSHARASALQVRGDCRHLVNDHLNPKR